MSLTEIRQVFPKLPFDIERDRFGVGTLIISDDSYDRLDLDREDISRGRTTLVSKYGFDQFKDIQHAELRFVDDQLSNFSLFYTPSIAWKSPDEFVKKIDETYELEGKWIQLSNEEWGKDIRQLKCADFSMLAGLSTTNEFLPGWPSVTKKYPFIEINDDSLSQIVAERLREESNRRNQIEQRKKDEFKP